jgi:hypothetical protein
VTGEGGDQVVHPRDLLGVYGLGALDPAEVREVDDHLATCEECRRELAELTEVRDLLGEVPPEAFLDGPPDDGELLLARVVRAARAEQAIAELDGAATPPVARGAAAPVRARRRWLRPVAAAAAVAVAAGAFAGGIALGRSSRPSSPPAAQASPSATTFPAGTIKINEHDPGTGVGMAVDMVPKVGWVEWFGTFTGVTPGTHCVLVIVTRAGQRVPAGAWIAPKNANVAPVSLAGTAIVAPAQVSGLEIDTTDGKPLVTWSI